MDNNCNNVESGENESEQAAAANFNYDWDGPMAIPAAGKIGRVYLSKLGKNKTNKADSSASSSGDPSASRGDLADPIEFCPIRKSSYMKTQ